MKIKIFKCSAINTDGLNEIEEKVNHFTSTHNTVDVKVTCTANKYGAVLLYTVLYRGE